MTDQQPSYSDEKPWGRAQWGHVYTAPERMERVGGPETACGERGSRRDDDRDRGRSASRSRGVER